MFGRRLQDVLSHPVSVAAGVLVFGRLNTRSVQNTSGPRRDTNQRINDSLDTTLAQSHEQHRNDKTADASAMLMQDAGCGGYEKDEVSEEQSTVDVSFQDPPRMPGLFQYLRLSIKVLYLPIQTSDKMARGKGVKYPKTRKALLSVVALDCPSPNIPGRRGSPGGFCM